MIKLHVPVMIDGIEQLHTETVYTIDDFPYDKFLGVDTVRGKHGSMLNIPSAFDIETTTVSDTETPYAFMYQWQFCIDDTVVFGRTWEQYAEFLKRLHYALGLSNNMRLPVYVHNLSFEFQFLKSFFDFQDVFAREKREPIRAASNGIEYRCSYYLSNMSLEKFCKNTENVIHYKMTDTYNYKLYRTPNTELSEEEMAYCYNDVRGLCECIREKLKQDDVLSIPMTSTGYVRRGYRRTVLKNPKNRKLILDTALAPELYIMCREAFRGGDVHANYRYTGQILENVRSYDKQSSYPASMMMDKYPMTKFMAVSASKFNRVITQGYACIFRCLIKNVRFNMKTGDPYIDIAHCRNYKNIVNDNGRVLSADFLEMTITDIDYHIITKCYNIEEFYIKDLYISKYDYLPAEFRNELMYYFTGKCELKGVPGKEYEYAKFKEKVNSSYGMMVTDIAQDNVNFVNGEWVTENCDIVAALRNYYKNRNSFLAYQWGVWVTANARKRLYDLIMRYGADHVYNDTDSVKGLGDHTADIAALNLQIRYDAEHAPIPAVAHVGEKTFVLGEWEDDGHYDRFRTWGSKKYCSETPNGKISLTVAGLNKKLGALEIQNTGGIYEFKIGKTFVNSGRLTAYYNDEKPHYIIGNDGTKILTGSNVALVDTTYTLGVTNEYRELIQFD